MNRGKSLKQKTSKLSKVPGEKDQEMTLITIENEQLTISHSNNRITEKKTASSFKTTQTEGNNPNKISKSKPYDSRKALSPDNNPSQCITPIKTSTHSATL